MNVTSGGAAAEVPAPYFDGLIAALERARAANCDSLAAAARIVADVVAADGIVYVFGSGHSQLAALEMSRRAGGIVPLQVILDPTWGAAEDVEGFAETLPDGATMGPNDCLVAISNSGRTAAALELALRARSRGMPVVAVTSARASAAAAPRHRSGARLFEVADVVLDTAVPNGDGAVRLGGVDEPLGPTSTLVAAALLHEVVVEAAVALASTAHKPPLYRPNSAPGGREHNERMWARYRGRIRLVP